MWIHASYITSEENKEADKQSRILPQETEWDLADLAFDKIIEKFGEFEIDLFASRVNKKCQRYVSRHRDPESVAIDAFKIDWYDYFFYAFLHFT